MSTKFGTHNLHDDTGNVTAFADIIVFTEAIPAKVKKALPDYRVYVCRHQKDLVIAVRKSTNWRKRGLARYKKIVNGQAKVTPNRGTFWIKGTLDGKPTVIIAEHRINAAFPPFIRGEADFRSKMWHKHTDFTIGLIKKFKDAKKKWQVLAAGDLNTIHRVKGYASQLKERGNHFDRLGAHGIYLGDLETLSREGSDHNRYRATIDS